PRSQIRDADGPARQANGSHPEAEHRQERQQAANDQKDAGRNACPFPVGLSEFVDRRGGMLRQFVLQSIELLVEFAFVLSHAAETPWAKGSFLPRPAKQGEEKQAQIV